MIPILGMSFVGPTAARLAFMLVACASLALQTPTGSHGLDASAAPDAFASQLSANSAGDREWRNDVDGSVSDACDDDDDDDGDGDPTAGSGPLTVDRCRPPDFSDSAYVGELTEDRHGSRGRDLYLLRGPPAVPMESSNSIDDAAGTHPAPSGCREKRRDRHAPLLRNPFLIASAQSDYGLRAPP